MSILADITTLETKKSEFDLLRTSNSASIQDKYKLEILKEEMLSILSNIFSVYSSKVISNSFYLQVNEIEKQICNLIVKKNEELNLISKEKDKIVELSKKVITYVSSAYILQNDIHVGLNIEKRLLDIKNDIINLKLNNKRLCALSFVEARIEKYATGLKRLIEIVSEYKEKSSISFELRQEIFDIFKKISLTQQIDKSHSKTFNESINDENIEQNTTDYIKWYENILLENCDAIGLNLNSYYFEICNYLTNKEISTKSILDFVDEYIFKKYTVEINLFHRTISNAADKLNSELKHLITHCYSYNEDFNFDHLLVKLESDSYLLDLFDNKQSKEMVKKLHYKSKIASKSNVILYTVLDELNSVILKNFNFDIYFDLYMANSKYKNKQIASFRIYFIDVLEKSKNELIKKFTERIENTLSSREYESYNIDSVISKHKIKEIEIEELNQALSYINANYRNYNEENAKLYLKGVENKYSVSNLYEKISSRNCNIIYKFKTKQIIKKELPYIECFINNTDLLNSIKELLISNVIVNKSLINELQSSMIS